MALKKAFRVRWAETRCQGSHLTPTPWLGMMCLILVTFLGSSASGDVGHKGRSMEKSWQKINQNLGIYVTFMIFVREGGGREDSAARAATKWYTEKAVLMRGRWLR